MWVNKAMARNAFGWSYLAWSKAFFDAVEPLPNSALNVLELGAGDLSIVSLVFDSPGTRITVGYHADQHREPIQRRIESLKVSAKLEAQYSVAKADAYTVSGKYDVVIMKSVLGGLFRSNTSSLPQIESFVAELRSRTVAPGGLLISIDNGESVFEKYVSGFGARRNHWRRFRRGQLQSAKVQGCFGVISAFSVETRWGPFGYFLDNKIMYPIDRLLTSLIKTSPTIITSVF